MEDVRSKEYMSKEHWKQFPGFEGTEISNYGNVRQKVNTNYKTIKPIIKEGKYWVEFEVPTRYVYGGSKKTSRQVDYNMLVAFLGKPRQFTDVVYKDFNKMNCILDNVFYAYEIAETRTKSKSFKNDFNTSMLNIGNTLITIREYQKKSLEQVEKESGISVKKLSNIESRVRQPSLEEVYILSRVYDVPMDTLM